MALKRAKRDSPAEKVLRRFVELARALPQVQLILLADDTDEGRRIWTVIDAPRFEEGPRDQVYEAQHVALRDIEESPFGFRVINIQELKHPLEHVLPPVERLLFDRKTAG